MRDLPPSWTWAKIVDVLAANANGKPFQQGWSPQCERHPAGNDEWGVLKTTAIQDDEFLEHENKRLPDSLKPRPHLAVEAGDILMTCAGPRSRCGVVCFVKRSRGKLMMSGKMYRFRCDPDKADSEYLAYFLHSREAQDKIHRMKTGINDSGLNLTHGRFSELDVPLAPRNEQGRICRRIEKLFAELDKGTESLKTARRQLEIYRQAVLKHAFEGKLTAQWREENKDKLETPEQLLARVKKERVAHYERQLVEWKVNAGRGEKNIRRSLASRPAKLKDVAGLSPEETEGLPLLPGGWSYSRLGLLIDEPKYGTSKKCDYNFEGTGVLRIPNVVRGLIDDADLKGACFEDDEKWAFSLRSGDILMIRSNGSIAIVGKCALMSSAEQQYLYAGYLIRIRSNPVVVLPEYLAPLISSHLVRVQIEGFAKSTSGVNNINSGEIQSLIVPLCGVPEQQEVVAQLSSVICGMDATAAEIDEQLRTTDTLRQAILKKAFAGQLVTQDPSDEPASVLLEKIRMERAKAGKSGPTARKNRKAKTAA